MQPKLILLFILLLIWEISIWSSDVPKYIFPRPTDILNHFWDSYDSIAPHFILTSLESLCGLLLGTGVGILLATVICIFPHTSPGIRPAIIALQSTPLLAVAPIINMWFGTEFISKVILASIVCFPPIAVTVIHGFNSVPSEELDLFRLLRATKFQTFWHLRKPRCTKSFFIALQVSGPLAVLGAIVGEFVGSSQGLGFYIMSSSYYARTTAMFSAVLLSIILSLIIVYIAKHFESKYEY